MQNSRMVPGNPSKHAPRPFILKSCAFARAFRPPSPPTPAKRNVSVQLRKRTKASVHFMDADSVRISSYVIKPYRRMSADKDARP